MTRSLPVLGADVNGLIRPYKAAGLLALILPTEARRVARIRQRRRPDAAIRPRSHGDRCPINNRSHRRCPAAPGSGAGYAG